MSMTDPMVKYIVMLLVGASVAGCERTPSDDAPVADPFAQKSARTEDQFGKGFGKAYRADPKSEPAPVVKGDLIPVSHTAEPLAIE